MKNKTPSESTLLNYWRKAVRANYGDRCAKCGAQPVECHHIIKRRYKITAYDWRNGIALCHACHNWIETIDGRIWLYIYLADNRILYLHQFEKTTLKQYLSDNGLTRDEFYNAKLAELKKQIKMFDM